MRPGVGRTTTTPRFARKRALPRPADEEQRDSARRSDQRERQEAAEPGMVCWIFNGVVIISSYAASLKNV